MKRKRGGLKLLGPVGQAVQEHKQRLRKANRQRKALMKRPPVIRIKR